jgi:hypothetical protein
MPRGDRRGPNGMGPITGRAAGFCCGSNTPGFTNTGAVGGYGQGRSTGRGAGRQQVGCSHMQPGAGRQQVGCSHMQPGAGRGMGRGFQPSYNVPVYSKETEKGYIEKEVSFLKDQLKALEGRLADMQEDE